LNGPPVEMVQQLSASAAGLASQWPRKPKPPMKKAAS
jgi:hypothetical protein